MDKYDPSGLSVFGTLQVQTLILGLVVSLAVSFGTMTIRKKCPFSFSGSLVLDIFGITRTCSTAILSQHSGPWRQLLTYVPARENMMVAKVPSHVWARLLVPKFNGTLVRV